MALDFLKDYPSSVESVPNLDPTQMALRNKTIGSAGKLLNETNQYKFDFAPIEEQARADFQSKTIPTLAERFVGGGGLRSSAFQGAYAGAGANLDRELAAMKAEYGLRNQGQQQSHLSNLLGYGLQPSSENFYTPPQEGPGKQLVDAAGNIIGNLGGAALSGHLAGRAAQATSGTAAAQTAANPSVWSKIGSAFGIGGGAAAASASPLLPILGGLAGAAFAGWGISRLVKRIKAKRQNAREVAQSNQQLLQFEQYRNNNPQEFEKDFPARNKGESLEQWANRVDSYVRTKAKSQGVNNLDQLISEAS